ncbi:MAG: (5-formylfuran-3-yl)methyl phosphate synthase [Burkholderiaceae bacterium]|nr:(5-formylfuran-3-yl)methyl phosphate synthase [Burkholderiaceae bacterium]
MTIKLLVSVRSVAEALLAARGGADFIDLKEPGQGALGGLPPATIAAIVAALRAAPGGPPISATIGDVAMSELAEIVRRVQAVAACGVDYVKVGIEPVPAAAGVLEALAGCGHPVVPVFIADRGIDGRLLQQALGLGFPGLMADTADKRAGSLFDLLPEPALRALVAQVRECGAMVGLAGALRLGHLPALRALAPDFAGFRSAVCAGDRGGALDPARLAALVHGLRSATDQGEEPRPSPISQLRTAVTSSL